MPRRALSLSAQQIDPLSWFTGPHLALVLAVVAALYGTGAVVASWTGDLRSVAQIAAVLLVVLSLLFVQVMTRPQQRFFDAVMGVAAVGLASLGVLVSAIGFMGAELALEQWWAPFGLALTIGAMGPYLSTRELVCLGLGATLVTVPGSFVLLWPWVEDWGPVSALVIIAVPSLLSTVITGVFSHFVVTRMAALLASRSQIVVSTDVVRDEAAELAERVRLAQLSARAVPFLRQIAATGEITPANRSLAGQLARRLRDDLVTQSNRSWLESIAAATSIAVVDPDRRADRMRQSQRTALRGLVSAILDTPGIDAASLLIELRARPRGATAVGVSLDVDLPEGRRIMNLAPYVLTLTTAAEHLRWEDERRLRVTFQFPGEADATERSRILGRGRRPSRGATR